MVYCQRTMALNQADLGSNLDLQSISLFKTQFL